VFVSRNAPPFTEPQLRNAIRLALCWRDVLRLVDLGLRGNNTRTVQKYARLWDISTEHFDVAEVKRRANRRRSRPLSDILVEHSSYSRGSLKRRLFEEGLKDRRCELCGQGEQWHGRRLALILDHVNGIADDNRLENLQIVCPNCAATLDTHCGRNPVLARPRRCLVCDAEFMPRHTRHRYCSRACFGRANGARTAGVPQPALRKVERPPYEVLMAEIAKSGFSAVGRKYGVSDNAVRKWVAGTRRRGAGSVGAQCAAGSSS
jgi:hypothetical protein